MQDISNFDVIVKKLGNKFIGYKVPIHTTLSSIRQYHTFLLQLNAQFGNLINVNVINYIRPDYPIVIDNSVNSLLDKLVNKCDFDRNEYIGFFTNRKMFFLTSGVKPTQEKSEFKLAKDTLSKLVRKDGVLIITKYVNLCGLVGMIAEEHSIGTMLSLRHSVTEEIYVAFKQRDPTGYLTRGNTIEEVINNLINI